MISTNFIQGARSEAAAARTEARPDVLLGGYPAGIREAKIISIQAPGVYKVGIVGDDDQITAEIEGVRAFPFDDSLTPDSYVLLIQSEGKQIPYIMRSGGGGSGCSRNIFEWGVLFD